MKETRKWILHRLTAIILAPLYIWLYFSLVSLSTKSYSEATYFFENPLFKILTVMIFFWLVVLSFGESNYELFLLIINSFLGKFILIGFTWSMSFHLLSGIRHLVWDLGYGFEIKTANISGIIVIISSLVLTIIFWLFARGFI